MSALDNETLSGTDFSFLEVIHSDAASISFVVRMGFSMVVQRKVETSCFRNCSAFGSVYKSAKSVARLCFSRTTNRLSKQKTLNIMKASEKAYSLVQQFEGLRLTAYRCPAGVWTVGYGHSGVVPGIAITKELAEEFLKQDIIVAEGIVNAECLNLRQCQFDTLVSFVFNVGGGNFRKSTLLKKIKANPDDNAIMDEFLRWVYANGVVLPGLQKRRLVEMKLYFSEG